MKRKDFLKKAAQAAFGLSIISTSISSCKKDNEIILPENCDLTPEDAEGPYFVSNTNKVVNLNTKNAIGTPMLLSGIVYSGKGISTPLTNAKIEIWHADNEGNYHPAGSGDTSNYLPEEINLRGFVVTDKDGKFSVSSIFPGLYGSRARHIHYKITAKNHEELTTQSYFIGDERIPYDDLSKNAAICRIIEFIDNNGTMEGSIDFHIEQI